MLLGIVMVYDALDPAGRVRCRLAWSRNPLEGWEWVEGDEARGPEFVPLGAPSAFDSHVCFAAASPVAWRGAERIYYMGGNGPHSGARNSSLGMATLRQDGYAGLAGRGRVTLQPVLCTAELLTVTYDAPPGGGSLRIGLANESAAVGLSLSHSIPLTGSATDASMHFEGGCGGPSFYPFVGKIVTLAVVIEGGGTLYTVGFRPREGQAGAAGEEGMRGARFSRSSDCPSRLSSTLEYAARARSSGSALTIPVTRRPN